MDKSTKYEFKTVEGHWFSGGRDSTGHGELHSFDDEPCVIYADGTKWWYENGRVSRPGDKPAVVWPNGTEEYWQAGRRHRPDGPAVIFSQSPELDPRCRGLKQWWVNGVKVRESK